jgi:hypothetical protein
MVGLDTQEKPKDRPFNPAVRAWSPKGKSLVAEVIRRCDAEEPALGLRKRARRPYDRGMFELQIEAVVSDLTQQYVQHQDRRVAVTRSKAILGRKCRYRSPVLGKTLPKVIDLLASPGLSLVDECRGKRQYFTPDGIKQTTLRAGTALIVDFSPILTQGFH